MQLNPSIFREYDIRGRENDQELNVNSLELLGKAYGTFLAKRGIQESVVAHDNRATSEEFYQAAIRGLLSSGCNVIEIGMTTTPMFYWSQHYLQTKGGLMVTASHNPVGWNGLKLALGYSYTLNQQELQEIRQTIEQESFSHGQGRVLRKEDIFLPYKKDLLSRVSGIGPFKVVVNTGNGTAGFFT